MGELGCDKISRKTFQLERELTVDGYKTYVKGLLDPTSPSILVRYVNKLTWSDTLTKGMSIDISNVSGIRYMNVGGANVEFKVEVESVSVSGPESGDEDMGASEHDAVSDGSAEDGPVVREGCRPRQMLPP